MGMTGWNMWREKEARKKAEIKSVAVDEKVEAPKIEEVEVEKTDTSVAPKKGKKPVEK